MKAFRCSRTGLLYPADYIEGWGTKYGIGLGPVPISEALVNDYHRPVVGEGSSAMHGLSVARAQMDCVEVTEEEFAANAAILDADDTKMIKRGSLMRDKQLVKSREMISKFPDESSVLIAKKNAKAAA